MAQHRYHKQRNKGPTTWHKIDTMQQKTDDKCNVDETPQKADRNKNHGGKRKADAKRNT